MRSSGQIIIFVASKPKVYLVLHFGITNILDPERIVYDFLFLYCRIQAKTYIRERDTTEIIILENDFFPRLKHF